MSTPTNTAQAAKLINTISANILTPSSAGYINPASVPVPTLAYAYDTGITYINSPNKTGGVFTPVWVEMSRAGFDIDDHAVRGVVLENVASLAAFTVSSTVAPSTDGLTYVANNRVLLAGQTTASQNGVYSVGVVSGGAAPLTRVLDMPAGATIPAATYVYVSEGTIGAGSFYRQVTPGPVTVGTTALVFVQTPNSVTGPFRARAVASTNVVLTPVAGSTTMFTIPSSTIDGTAVIAAGDRLLLAFQTTGSQSGLYIVVSVTATVPTIQLAPEWQQGTVTSGAIVEVGPEGTEWGSSTWKATAAPVTAGGYLTVGTTDPLFFPRKMTGLSAAGAVAGLWVLAVPAATTGSQLSVTDLSGAAAVGVTASAAGRGTGSLTIAGGGASNQWCVINF